MADIPTMSLKAAPIQYSAFTPVQYTPQIADSTLLAKSMAAQEERKEKTNQYILTIDTTINEKKELVTQVEYV